MPRNRTRTVKPPSSVFRSQLKVLVKKDFWIFKKHKKAVCCELLIPLVMVGMAAFFMILTSPTEMSPMSVGLSTTYFLGYYTVPVNAPPNIVNRTSSSLRKFGAVYYPNESAALSNWTEIYDYADPCQYYWCWRLEKKFVGLFGPEGVDYSKPLSPSVVVRVFDFQLDWREVMSLAASLFRMYNDATASIQQRELHGLPDGNRIVLPATIAACVLALSFLPMFANTSGKLVDEKMSKMREHLRVMGVHSSAYILGTFCSSAIRVLFISICVVIALPASGAPIPGATLPLYLIFLVLFGAALVANSLFISCFFRRSSFASAVSVLYLVFGTGGGLFITELPVAAQRAFVAFFSPVAYVMIGPPLFTQSTFDIPISVGEAGWWLVFQIVLYTLLGQYVYLLYPGEYGVPQKASFPFHQLLRWWSGPRSQSKERRNKSKPPLNLGEDAIVLESLYKHYGGDHEVAAVDGLSLSIRKGEIFALLGHNGAGKTTTISMLTGMAEPSSYKRATINGHDMTDGIDVIRHQIGTCPQFDILFDDLTGQQHLEFFAAIKGKSARRGPRLLDRLKLPGSEKMASDYSGGMKRRLSVACAIIGGSPVLFLDEPSSGLDPLSRRQLWDMIREEKARGKTIILTTHFMEEADYLGDRIAIMSRGKLFC